METKEAVMLGIVGAVALLAAFWWLSDRNAGAADFADSASPVSYYYSNSCSHCKDQKVVLSELATEGFRVNPVDVGDNYERLEQYGVRGTPTFRAADGTELTGFTEKDRLRSWLAAHGAKLKQA